ncbi:hypothetical protein ACOZ4F_00510 (plasmid) [Haloarcula marismortui]|uniref:hypothetical protein n=1 Tax=Haloarcula marismortui TaxID=2238 RepID=UPI003C711771
MVTNSGGDDTPYEIEVSLDNGADLELTYVDVNTDGEPPLSFEVKGVITEENGTLDSLRGMALSPKAVRFEVTDQ